LRFLVPLRPVLWRLPHSSQTSLIREPDPAHRSRTALSPFLFWCVACLAVNTVWPQSLTSCFLMIPVWFPLPVFPICFSPLRAACSLTPFFPLFRPRYAIRWGEGLLVVLLAPVGNMSLLRAPVCGNKWDYWLPLFSYRCVV